MNGTIFILVLAVIGYRRALLNRSLNTMVGRHRLLIAPLLATMVMFALYHLAVGPYTEIPADFWARMGDVVSQLNTVANGRFEPGRLLDDKIYVPFLHAVVAGFRGTLPIHIVPGATLATSLLFLTIVYWFFLWTISSFRVPKINKVAGSVLSVLLVVSVYGVSVFSYVRYYAYFPHILNSGLMLVTLMIYTDYFERANASKYSLLATLIFVVVMLLVNRQEALFTLVVLGALSLWKLVKEQLFLTSTNQILRSRIKFAGLSAGVIVISALTIVVIEFEIGPLGIPHLIDIGHLLSIGIHLPIANPTMRFWEVVGIFGVAVFLWYLIRIQWFARMDLINVLMMTPLLTLFNPVFVIWYLRLGSWDSLWRFSYLMPIAIVGAVLITLTLSKQRLFSRPTNMVFGLVFTVVLMVALAPFEIGTYKNVNSRFPSLVSVDETNGATLWMDVIHFIAGIPDSRLLITDSVTNYVLSMSTHHSGKYDGGKGGGDKESWQFKYDPFWGDYQDRLLGRRFDDALLIINNRDGHGSETGRVSGHWWDHILSVSHMYPDGIKKFIEDSPDEFRLLWSKRDIWVYEILRGPDQYDS